MPDKTNDSMPQADTSSAAEPVPSPLTIEEAVSRFCLGQAKLMDRLARVGTDNPEPSIGGHPDGQI
ncbi:MAG: hypothetical protein ACOYOU_03090 [Kiritimatiellia bacterium]